jgi:hypothetical protein
MACAWSDVTTIKVSSSFVASSPNLIARSNSTVSLKAL